MTQTDNNNINHDNKDTTAPAAAAEEVPWHAAYPSPRNVAPSLSRQELLQWFHDDKRVVGKDFVLVDVRRVDFEVRIDYTYAYLHVQCRTNILHITISRPVSH
jgi:hypothetical protein